jgi:hypothetical protein
LNLPDTIKLEELSSDGLASLCKKIGLAQRGTKQEMSYRIGGHPLPPTTSASALTSANPPTNEDGTVNQTRFKKLMTLSGDQLKNLCKANSLSYSGTKNEKALRIIKWESRSTQADVLQRDVDEFRTPKSSQATRPTINDHYGRTFNLVDRFNRLTGYISYEPRCTTEKMRYLTSCVQIAIINTWVLFTDWKEGDEHVEKNRLRTFSRSLAASLLDESWLFNFLDVEDGWIKVSLLNE